jgi:CDP-diglyceride synthetase
MGFRSCWKCTITGLDNHDRHSSFFSDAIVLKQRILAAVVFLVVFLAALFCLPQFGLLGYWAGLTALVAAAFAWEWGRLMGLGARGRRVFAGLQLLLCLGFGACLAIDAMRKDLILPEFLFTLATIALHVAPFFWCVLVPFWLKGRWHVNLSANAMSFSRNLLLLLGVLLILAAWFALFMGKYFFYSEWAFLAVLGLAWVVEIASWLSRRASRLAIARLLGYGIPVVYGLCLEIALARWHGVEAWRQGCVVVLIAFLLPVVGILGHRLESLLRRQAGMAERLPLLPGCGSLLAILPVSFWCHNAILYPMTA